MRFCQSSRSNHPASVLSDQGGWICADSGWSLDFVQDIFDVLRLLQIPDCRLFAFQVGYLRSEL